MQFRQIKECNSKSLKEIDKFPLIILIEEAHYEQIDNDILTRDEGVLALYTDEALIRPKETLKTFKDYV